MSPRPEQPHAVRRVVLPSGKTIEVVYFADSEGGQVANAPTGDLHVCPDCTSTLVYPTAWEEGEAPDRAYRGCGARVRQHCQKRSRASATPAERTTA